MLKYLLPMLCIANTLLAQDMVPIAPPPSWIVDLDAPRVVRTVAASEHQIPGIVIQRCASVGLVKANSGNTQQYGTASYIGDGLWLTNAHVVQNDYGQPAGAFSVFTKDGREHRAVLRSVEQDKEPDLAVLETAPISLPPIPIARDGVGQNEVVFPTGFDRGDMSRHKVWPARVVQIYNSGDLESVGWGQRLGAISGNSGGPTFNAQGELLAPLNANGGQEPGVTSTGRGSTITVSCRATRTYLLPFRERIMRAIAAQQTQCPPGSQYCPPQQHAYPQQQYQPQYQQQPQGQDYSQTIPQYQPPVTPEPPAYQPPPVTPEIDYDKLAASLVPKLAEDDRFRGSAGVAGPAGERGPAGPQGPKGDAGELTEAHVSRISSTLMAALRSDPAFRGPQGEPGVNASANRRVVVMSGGEIIDDETYGENEAIVLDLQRITRAAQ